MIAFSKRLNQFVVGSRAVEFSGDKCRNIIWCRCTFYTHCTPAFICSELGTRRLEHATGIEDIGYPPVHVCRCVAGVHGDNKLANYIRSDTGALCRVSKKFDRCNITNDIHKCTLEHARHVSHYFCFVSRCDQCTESDGLIECEYALHTKTLTQNIKYKDFERPEKRKKTH